MIRAKALGILAAGAVMSVTAFAPMSAHADSLQNQKNNMRNLAIAGGAAALLGLSNHNSTLALIGAAGAALAGSQYEKDRKQQSQENRYYGWDRGGRYRHNWNNNRNYHRDNYRSDYRSYHRDNDDDDCR